MPTYKVTCGYREDNGMHYAFPTHKDIVEVKAENKDDARRIAIDAMYDKHGPHCSHVRPAIVEELGE